MNRSVIDMSAVQERRELTPASDATALLQVIERAARDPNTDIGKMKELFAMRKEIAAEAAENAFNDALNLTQSEMGPIATDATNPQTRSKYATYAKLDGRLRPIYTRHGFALSFDEGESPKAEHVRVLCYMSHRGGHTRTYRADMPADGKGAKGGDVMTKTHAAGAAKSYGKRYLLKDIFNIAIGEEDTDGNVDGLPLITEKQAADLDALITEHGLNKPRLLTYFKLNSLGQIPAKNFEWTVAEIKRTAKAREDRAARETVK